MTPPSGASLCAHSSKRADLAGDRAKLRRGKINDAFADKGEVHRQPRALAADGRFGDLHHHAVPLPHVELGRDRALRFGGHIPGGKIAVPLPAVCDKRRLHARKHVDDAPFVDIPRRVALLESVRMEFDELARFDNGGNVLFAETVKI